MVDPLEAVSPLDGRYAGRTEPLRAYASERALMGARVRVEVEYLIALSTVDPVGLTLSADDRDALRAIYREFDREDARLVKRIETEGYGDYPATNHDVKAVEYFLRERASERLSRRDRRGRTGGGDGDDRGEAADGTDDDGRDDDSGADGGGGDGHGGGGDEADGADGTGSGDGRTDLAAWIHFGLTSEDVTNLAYRLLARGAVEDELLEAVRTVRDELAGMAHRHRDLPMLARTHGQPATPTTFGKEMAVYAARLGRATGRVTDAVAGLSGKFGGATGTFGAHQAAFPRVDWRAFARSFVEDLGLEYLPATTQVNPGDDLAALFDALTGVNRVLLDLARDAWLYVSRGYLGQRVSEGEVGSSTMPHKVNPIDFENAEGNLARADADLSFLGEYLTTSRLQRDLSGSTVRRTIGAALAHCLIAYRKLADGLDTVVPNRERIAADLEAHPEVIAEAVQTVLRREGRADAYERVRELTRGQSVTMDDFRALFDDLPVEESVREELRALTPSDYTGLAEEIADDVGE